MRALPLAERCEARTRGLERQLPVPRPKREKPERSTRMLIVEAPDGRVLLEKRPPSGVWGGLWCFPQLDAEETGAAAHAAEQLDLDPAGVEQLEEWAEVRHVFTHFALRIRPVRLRARTLPDAVREGNRAWFDPADVAALGLAAPVRRLLGALAGDDLLG